LLSQQKSLSNNQKTIDKVFLINYTVSVTNKQTDIENLTERSRNMELLRINYESEQPTVSARELHEGLEIKSNYTTWFNRMCEYGFEVNIDFKTRFPKMESESHGGQNMIDHEISIDMAK